MFFLSWCIHFTLKIRKNIQVNVFMFILQNLPNGLKAAAQRGLVSIFMALSRKCPVSRLGKQDELGTVHLMIPYVLLVIHYYSIDY